MRFLFLLFFLTPLSIKGQKIYIDSLTNDTVSYHIIIPDRDSVLLLRTLFGTEANFFSFKIKESTEKDSAKLGLLTQTTRPIVENYPKNARIQKMKHDSMVNALLYKPIPDFDAPDTSGFVHRPMQYRGRVLILHFFNFWDYSFDNEIPVLNSLIEKYHSEGLEILSFMDIDITDSEKRKLKETPVHFPLIRNARKFMQQFLPIKKGVPYLILVDKMGHFRYLYLSFELSREKRTFTKEGIMVRTKIDTDFGLEDKIKILLKE